MSRPPNTAQELRKASALEKQGEFDRAAAIYAAILKKFPNNPKARRALASIRAGTARPKQPEGRIARTLGDLSPFADPLDIKTVRARMPSTSPNQTDMLSAASGEFAKPNFAAQNEARVQLRTGMDNLERGHPEAAREDFARAVRLDAQFADGHYFLGVCLNQLGMHADALASLSAATRLKPDFVDALLECGVCAKALGRYDEALAHLSGAIEIAPDFVAPRLLRAEVLHALDQSEPALSELDAALDLEPENGNAHAARGPILLGLGRADAAAESLATAIRLDPGNFAALAQLGTIRRFKPGDPEVAGATRALGRPDLSALEQSAIHFFLAKVDEDAGRIGKAFDHLVAGNEIRKQNGRLAAIDYRAVYGKIRNAFSGTTPRLATKAPALNANLPVTPIFIIGMPRSGTTLAEQILASHSQVYGGGELPTIAKLIESIGGETAIVDQRNLAFLRDKYIASLQLPKTGARYVTDKMPQNFVNLGFLISAMPDAKFIHTMRDPVATCWSCFKHNFGGEFSFSYTLRDVAEYYNLYREMMAFWCDRFPGRIYPLDYEKLTENQEHETRNLLAHVGLDWEDACLDFHKTARSVRTVSVRQVRQGLYKGSSQAWRRYEQFLGPMTRILDGN